MFVLAHSGRVLGLVLLLPLVGFCAPVSQAISYNRDIRPILSDNCFACHGPDKGHREAELRLDVRDIAVSNRPDHKVALVPGKHAESAVYQRITATDPKLKMPPPTSTKKLSAREIELLTRWIDEGAAYEPHWAYVPPRRPTPPAVPGDKWAINDIDRFVLGRLVDHKLKPSPAAERHALIRRLSLDLTGLPPTPAEVAAFAADSAPDAYDKLVERLLASPHYGERMASPWLDAVRFADTVGYHGDQNQNIYPYRDYVINAFNNNKPFDQFTIEQIAGDLLPDPTPEQRVATGFNRLNMMTREGGAQPKEYLAKYAADRVRTISGAWLGSTMGCAECHDHKFDPFSQKDFYSMEAFFADLRQWGVYADYGYTSNPDLAGFNNSSAFPPEIEVDTPALKERREKLWQQQLDTAATNVNPAAFAAWRAECAAALEQNSSGWITPKAGGADYAADAAGWLVSTGAAADAATYTLAPAAGWLSAIRLELQPRGPAGGTIWAGGTNRDATLKLAGQLGPTNLIFRYAEAYPKRLVYAGDNPVIGVLGGWANLAAYDHQPHTGLWVLDTPIRIAAGDTLTLTLTGAKPCAARISITPLAPQSELNGNWSAGLREALAATPPPPLAYAAYLAGTAWDTNAFAKYKAAFTDQFASRAGRVYSMVVEARTSSVMRVLARGNWQDDSGEIVPPSVPHFLPQPEGTGTRRLSRLDLARWLVSTNQPLTGRAVMNRVWKQFFGNGICATVEELGAQGEWPQHPDLLDWLAVEFRDSGWDVKHMVRLMVLSATYRQRSHPDPAVLEIDPQTRLLASQAPRRLEAEFVRDNALAIAGLLNRDVGGPSAKPYQPAGYYANIQFPNRDYAADTGSRQYRRGLYMHWQRTFLHPMLANFSAPTREEGVCRRADANTPQQALTLLNDPTFVEASRVLAAQLLDSPDATDEGRLALVYRKALARPPTEKERTSLKDFLGKQRDYFSAHPDDAKKSVRVGIAPAAVATNSAGVDAALAQWERRFADAAAQWVVLDIEAVATNAGGFVKQADRSLLAAGAPAATEVYTFSAKTDLKGITAIRLEALSDPSLPSGGPGRAGNGNFVLSEFKLKANDQPVALGAASADFSQASFPVANAIDGQAGDAGWAVQPSFNQPHAAVFQLRAPLPGDGSAPLVFTLDQTSQYAGHSIGRVRLSVTTMPDAGAAATPPAAIAAALAVSPAQRTAAQRQALIDFSGVQDSELAAWAQVCRVVLNLHETITRY